MESVIFVLTIVFVGYIVFWSIKNDKVKSISEQRGLLRMADHENATKDSTSNTKGP